MSLDLSQLSREKAIRALHECERFHFIGIGGVSMSGLARWLVRQGKTVTGTDRDDSARLRLLASEGATVEVGHRPDALGDAQCVVYTTAIPEDNPELLAARETVPYLLHRAELLAAVVAGKRAIAVTGTHGKTTTTTMLGHVLEAAGLDPLVIVGGDVAHWDGNVRFGEGEWAVFEACESDGSLLLYEGCCEVITSLEADHLDQHGTVERLYGMVGRFAERAAPDGFVVYNADSATVAHVAAATSARLVGYGEGAGEYRIDGLQPDGEAGTRFALQVGGREVSVKLRLYGEHNALNATAAIAAAAQAGVDEDVAARALESFASVARRFDLLGKMGDSVVIDDYAHHPTEIQATLRAAREHLGRPILAIFQPHLFSRTRDLMPRFAEAFGDADEVIITAIYAAREQPIPGVSAEEMATRARVQRHGRATRYVADPADIEALVRERYRDGWAILLLGAGNIRRLGERLVETEA